MSREQALVTAEDLELARLAPEQQARVVALRLAQEFMGEESDHYEHITIAEFILGVDRTPDDACDAEDLHEQIASLQMQRHSLNEAVAKQARALEVMDDAAEHAAHLARELEAIAAASPFPLIDGDPISEQVVRHMAKAHARLIELERDVKRLELVAADLQAERDRAQQPHTLTEDWAGHVPAKRDDDVLTRPLAEPPESDPVDEHANVIVPVFTPEQVGDILSGPSVDDDDPLPDSLGQLVDRN